MRKLLVGTKHSVLDTPKPARHYLPDWYKKLPQWVTGRPEIVETADGVNVSSKGPKTCVPFLDSFLTGYILELNQDVQVRANHEGYTHVINWQYQEIPPMDARDDKTMASFPHPEGYSDFQYVWKTHFAMKTPPGYSLLITHPFNRHDLPFHTLSGIVDAEGGMSTGNLPFYMKLGFDGIIPKGTPIAQVIPFKRDSWEIARDDIKMSDLNDKLIYQVNSVISGFYKKFLWKKKLFK